MSQTTARFDCAICDVVYEDAGEAAQCCDEVFQFQAQSATSIEDLRERYADETHLLVAFERLLEELETSEARYHAREAVQFELSGRDAE